MEDTSFSRIVGVLTSPTRTFRSIAERPTWLVPILVYIVLAAVSASIAAPKIDWQETITTKLERSDRVETPERIETVLGLLDEYGPSLALGSSLVMPWIIYPLIAAIFLSLFKTMGCELSLRTSLGLVAHSFMPWAVASLLSIPVLLTIESLNLYKPGFMTASLTAFAGDETGLELWILLSNIDLFSLWTIVLLVIGYSVAARVSKARAAGCVLGLWAVWVFFSVGMAALD